ncbi:E3 ubiquitin-protein ligase RING1-like protein [Carex littledalei]|uniref:E3 ubiquitin-protein ligase RING1-like protein n=1 Tax=Carex littledalei TaxID=544730 RepID=A0A833QKU9_9POAL|nr:E3 ubiquitin-protein ligase RING1-like protein [Carex littledalei]
MEPLPKKQWGKVINSAAFCYYKFDLLRPINLEECTDAIKDLEYNHDVLRNIPLEDLSSWWLKHLVIYRLKYPLAIRKAYRLLDGFTKPAEAESEKKSIHRLLDGFTKPAEADLEKPSTDESEKCAVCLDKLEETGRNQTRLVCNHIYHEDCIFKWVSNHKTCPLCRVVAVRDCAIISPQI